MLDLVILQNSMRAHDTMQDFGVIDKIADDYGISINKKEFKGLCGSGYIEGQKVLLLKPQTFMNLSGESIRAAADFYKVEPEDVVAIFDDISLDVGQLLHSCKRQRRWP